MYIRYHAYMYDIIEYKRVGATLAVFVLLLMPSFSYAETVEESLKKQLIQSLMEQVKALQSQVALIQKATSTATISAHVQRTSESFNVLRDKYGNGDTGVGKYTLVLDITADKDTLYIPVSIATGRKSNGLIYQVEGSERATSTATVSCRGENAVIVTSGTLSYCKVPAFKTVSFRVFVTVTASLREEFTVAIGLINYKLNPSDVRYKKYVTDIRTKTLKFR